MQPEKEYVHQFLNEMAQRNGSSEQFIYYTLDNEYKSHEPHVHVCVPIDNKYWTGKAINGKYKTVCAVKLNQSKYSLDNLEFEHIVDRKSLSVKCKKEIISWLNLEYRNFGITNAIHALSNYEDSNGD